jgi:hypothetical protein
MANLKRTLCVLPVMAGCYSYTPITPAAAPAGSEVRARITGAASDRVAPLLHSLDTRVLIGSVVENNAGEMVLQVPLGAMPNVAETIVPLQTRIPLAAADLVSLERRKLDVPRTTILVRRNRGWTRGGNRLWRSRQVAEPEPGRTPEEPPPIVRIPIWRIRIP